jgi:REP element-mobilizing transposase RayT
MEPLEFECTYHILNRANGAEPIFREEENYNFFLEKLKHYILPISEVQAYCLMPNHFHLLVRLKPEDKAVASLDLAGFQNLQGLPSRQFSNTLNSYAKAFNKRFDRKGSLFMRNMKRKKVTDEKYLIKLIHYIHYNPVEARLVEKAKDWKFSSYKAILSEKPTLVERKMVHDLFGGAENFRYCHQYPPKLTGVDDL